MSAPVARGLAGLAAASVRAPRAVLAIALSVVLLAVGVAAARLTLATSNLDLIDPRLPPVARFLAFAETFGTPNVLVVVLEGEDGAALRTAAGGLGPRLRAVPGVRGVIDKLPFDAGALAIAEVDPYLASRDGGMVFLFVQPDDPRSRADTIEPLVAGVRAALAAAGLEALGVRAGLTGMPVYALDDRHTIEGDIAVLSAISLALILALFVAAFGALRRPLAVILALLAGVAATLGLVALVPGHLTLLSAFFASILFGLGVDFGIHIVDRIEELVAAGRRQREAAGEAVAALARPLATSALTTSSVLLAMTAAGFRGFAELGWIAGIGVLLCALAMTTVLPAILALAAPRGVARRPPRRRLGRLLAAAQDRRLAWALAAATVLAAGAGGAGFDSDYLALQPRGSETVRLERAMVAGSDFSPAFAAFTAGSREQVKELTWTLINDPTVGAVRSLRDLEQPGMGGVAPELGASLRASLVGADGRLAVYAYPAGNIWDPDQQAAFLAHMTAIDPEVTGMPVLGSFMVARSRRALRIAAWLGAALLAGWLLADFRRPLPALLAALPAILTAAALGASMRLVGVAFNPLNVMALPVVLGIAVDDGVHLVHRFLAERGDLERTLLGSGRGVLLTSLTTLAAFGTLAFTSHRGLASFALALTLGVALALVLSVLVLPQLLAAAARRGWLGAELRRSSAH